MVKFINNCTNKEKEYEYVRFSLMNGKTIELDENKVCYKAVGVKKKL